jgi:hypothetical protein
LGTIPTAEHVAYRRLGKQSFLVLPKLLEEEEEDENENEGEDQEGLSDSFSTLARFLRVLPEE